MNFAERMRDHLIRRIPVDKERAASLKAAAEDVLATLKLIPVRKESAKTIVRETYEGIRQSFEVLGYERGYKFESHEAIFHFILDVLKEQEIAQLFDRYRLLRNKINYYGKEVDVTTAERAKKDAARIISRFCASLS